MKNAILLISIFIVSLVAKAQNTTDVSLFMRSDSTKYLTEVSSESGDLYTKVGHHGPAIENEWMGLRIYFDKKCVIDVYSKSKPGLELHRAKWYPTPEQQKNGWGADYYKVGNTLGLGGVRLWDGEKIVPLDPVTRRIARVKKGRLSSSMEMISEGVNYKGSKVDVVIRVTVYEGQRNARVEAFTVGKEPVQFVTGINYHPGEETRKLDGLIATWGLHPEDVAAEKVKIGAALIFEPEDFVEMKDDGTQFFLISKETVQIQTWISSACEKESELNDMDSFFSFLKKITKADQRFNDCRNLPGSK